MIFGTIARRNNELLTFFGYSLSAVPTNSMEGSNPDSIQQGSVIITRNVSYQKINEGDIIVFQDDGILKVHRVVKKTDEGLTTKGDNPETSEDPFLTTEDNYQAKVVRSFSFFGLGKYVPGFQLLVLFIMMLFLFGLVVYQIYKIIKINHERKVEKIKEEFKKN